VYKANSRCPAAMAWMEAIKLVLPSALPSLYSGVIPKQGVLVHGAG
jgi:hypothetical protein